MKGAEIGRRIIQDITQHTYIHVWLHVQAYPSTIKLVLQQKIGKIWITYNVIMLITITYYTITIFLKVHYTRLVQEGESDVQLLDKVKAEFS